MASVQDLKRRIRSIRNTRKITKAMELVASARLRRAQARIEAMRPYADRMMELMIGTARASSSVRSLPLLQRRECVESVAILPLTGDRGLAGAFNAQVLRHAFALARRAARPRAAGALARLGPEGRLDAPLPPARGAPGVDRLQRPAGVRGRAGARAQGRRALRRGGGRPRGHRLQPLRLAARPAGGRAGRAPDPGGGAGGGRGRGAARGICSATSSTSRSRSRSSSACSPSTSRPSSTARCSSRPRPSRAPG